jgi:hypothetical protein
MLAARRGRYGWAALEVVDGHHHMGAAMLAKRERERSPALTRLLAWIVLILMVVSTVYTVWIAVANFHRIGV